jgi:hypothetical protein
MAEVASKMRQQMAGEGGVIWALALHLGRGECEAHGLAVNNEIVADP